MIFKYQKIILTLELIAVVAVTIYSGGYALNAPTPEASETVIEAEAESIEKTVKESKPETAKTEETKKKDKKSETKAEPETVKKVVENKSETSASAPGSKNNSGASGGNNNNSSGVSSGNKNNSQPSGTNNSGNAGNANQNTAPSSPSTPAPAASEPVAPQTEHTHSWVEQTHTVHHDATGHYEEVVVQEAWDEPTYEMVEVSYCSTCGLKIEGDPGIHLDETMHGGYWTTWEPVQTGSIHHDAVTESKWVEDNPAWDETVIDGYVCSGCGATK